MTEKTIYKYGYNPAFCAGFEDNIKDENSIARICAVHRERYDIVCNQGLASARLKSSVYYSGNTDEMYPTVGDFVLIDYNDNGESRITKTLPRKSLFSRLDPSSYGHFDQAVAANFNYVFILSSLNNDFNTKRIERYLALAWQSGGIPVIILTKSDLVSDYEDQIKRVERICSGTAVFAVSALTGEGLDRLSDYLKAGKTIVFLGSSGVGKSSLVNSLARLSGTEEDIMKVNGIREDDSKGRHTTTHRQLIMLNNGVMIIDTPGMRELGMWDASEGLSESFSEIEQLFEKCRFTNCTHTNEPDCAVKEALESGELSEDRWNSYMQLKKESGYTENKNLYLKQKQEKFKNIARTVKSQKKGRDSMKDDYYR